MDLDPVTQVRWTLDLILGVRLRSGGQGGSGARDAAAPSPELCSAAASSPEKGFLGLPSSVWIAVGCKRASAARVVHWGTQGGGAGLRAWSSTARAVRWQRSSPGLAGSGPYVAPRANTSSAKGMAGLGLLTKVWSGWGRDAGGAGGEIRQRTRVELRGPSGAGLLRAWIPSNQSA